jgi:menaquinone-dependent protoporphyrinogen oxidase
MAANRAQRPHHAALQWVASEEQRGNGGGSVRILVAFASKHGSTEGIAVALGRRLEERGLGVDVRSVETVTDVSAYRGVVLGSALYTGSWLKPAVDFAERHARTLVPLPVWLFSSGPLGPVTGADYEQARQLGELTDLLLPEDHVVFPGALDMDRIGFAERMVMRAVRAEPGDYRDWDAVEAWADRIGDALTGSP